VLKGVGFMLNQLILVGKVTGMYEFVTENKDTEALLISLSLAKLDETEDLQNEVYVRLPNSLSKIVKESIEIGSTIGVKGHLSMNNRELNVVGDKITFISFDKDEID
jgi:hypothetical protein